VLLSTGRYIPLTVCNASLSCFLRFPGLDTGCVYGGRLTACILPEKRLVSVSAKREYFQYRRKQFDWSCIPHSLWIFENAFVFQGDIFYFRRCTISLELILMVHYCYYDASSVENTAMGRSMMTSTNYQHKQKTFLWFFDLHDHISIGVTSLDTPQFLINYLT